MRIKSFLELSILFFLTTLLLAGCGNAKKIDEENSQKLDFTVVKEIDYPEELSKMLESKKKDIFKFTYSDGENLYLCVGYGTKDSGGFSIVVDHLLQTDSGIHMKTTLKGPASEEERSSAITYPCIVIKTEFIDEPVMFET